MPFQEFVKIAGMSSVLTTIRTLCRFLGKYSASIRAFVPSEHQANYDIWVPAVLSLCALLEQVARDSITPSS